MLVHSFFQNAYLVMFIYALNWPRYWNWYFPCLALALILNAVWFRTVDPKQKQFLLSYSPILIGTSIFLNLTGYSFSTYAIAVLIAISSKYILRVGGKNVFNPSCFAVLCLSAYGEGLRVSPHTPGMSPYWILFIVMGGLLTSTVNRRVIASLSYVAGLIFFCAIFYLAGSKYAPIYAFSLTSYLGCLFTFHVLTDPQTSPSKPLEQAAFGVLIGGFDAIFRLLQITESNFVALALSSGLYALWRERQEIAAFWHKNRAPILLRAVPLTALAIVVVGGMRFGYYPKPTEDVFHSEAFASTQSSLKTPAPLHYEEVGETVKFGCAADFNEQGIRTAKHIPDGEAPFPGVAVADYDGDGFPDAMISGREFCLLHNDHGQRFVDVTAQVGLAGQNLAMASFFDLHGQGRQDIFAVTFFGEFRVFENAGDHYVDVTGKMRLPKYNLGEVRSINFLDYDRDGYVDVMISNFPGHKLNDSWRFVDLAFELPKKNFLFKNHGGEFFTDETDALGLRSDEYTHVIGISDMNGDGYPDLFIANDFGRDRILFNRNGRFFEDVSRRTLGNVESRNSMNAEFGDIDNSGRLALYSTNVSLARFRHGMNSLWTNDGTGNFEDKADDFNVGRCGFAWGAKYIDASLDGHLDIFVASGMLQGDTHIWYPYSTWTEIPFWARSLPLLHAIFPRDFDLGGHERNCFFWHHDGTFTDIASEIGLSGDVNGHTVALTDFDNSGRQMILLGGIDTQMRAYRPVLNGNPHWVGIKLVGENQNRDALGARVSVMGRPTYLKELYSGNSPSSQSDSRLVFGLGANAAPVDLEVVWPSGNKQVFHSLQADAYYTLTENSSKSAQR